MARTRRGILLRSFGEQTFERVLQRGWNIGELSRKLLLERVVVLQSPLLAFDDDDGVFERTLGKFELVNFVLEKLCTSLVRLFQLIDQPIFDQDKDQSTDLQFLLRKSTPLALVVEAHGLT